MSKPEDIKDAVTWKLAKHIKARTVGMGVDAMRAAESIVKNRKRTWFAVMHELLEPLPEGSFRTRPEFAKRAGCSLRAFKGVWQDLRGIVVKVPAGKDHPEREIALFRYGTEMIWRNAGMGDEGRYEAGVVLRLEGQRIPYHDDTTVTESTATTLASVAANFEGSAARQAADDSVPASEKQERAERNEKTIRGVRGAQLDLLEGTNGRAP